MGLFSRSPDERVVKPVGEDARAKSGKPRMHGSHGEWNLMAGSGSIINWGSGDVHVNVTGEKPGGGNPR